MLSRFSLTVIDSWFVWYWLSRWFYIGYYGVFIVLLWSLPFRYILKRLKLIFKVTAYWLFLWLLESEE